MDFISHKVIDFVLNICWFEFGTYLEYKYVI